LSAVHVSEAVICPDLVTLDEPALLLELVELELEISLLLDDVSSPPPPPPPQPLKAISVAVTVLNKSVCLTFMYSPLSIKISAK
jgi:hypothetical protein